MTLDIRSITNNARSNEMLWPVVELMDPSQFVGASGHGLSVVIEIFHKITIYI